jgi:predicted dienelactone hydrolase
MIMVSPGHTCNNWEYLFIGTRLASHGFVVVLLDHENDGAYSWTQVDATVVAMFNRIRDTSFAITELLLRNESAGELLQGVVDPSRIAMSGHSLGGSATYALVGGDDEVCDALWGAKFAGDSLPEPQFTCISTEPDPRIRAIALLDGTSTLMRYRELARISVPSLILGETVEHITSYNPWSASDPDAGRWSARAHAAINRIDSYRIDVALANHNSFGNWCDGLTVMSNLGVDLKSIDAKSPSVSQQLNSYPCVVQGTFDPANNPATRQIVTTYMLAFLNTYLGREDDSWMLTSSYARQYQPNVEFFDSEVCNECPVRDGEYSYRPHPCQCSVARKDPADYFAPSSDGGAQ